MQKEELIHLHMLMMHIKKYCESMTKEELPSERYDSLDISPLHIHKEKKAHKDALLTLGDEIVTHIHRQSIPGVNSSSDTASTQVAAIH